ncbi:MAG: radical SAM family heme chaperone HemW [Alphaproteobacteria bacterium]|jgi:oxygen-independent coproporphyrinogen-3 oxidase|nr:radical SAM family heme chaperone HemW [Alphaproteobacteria bacterium]MDP7222949.1 radical SAM family heme chaperone HemW [Alphaproteobacteria bacterium]
MSVSQNLPLFGVYVHWPFCAAKCPYCDFNSHVREEIDHDAWAQAYRQEIRHYYNLTPDRTVTSVFFGGGTPSLMKPETVQVIMDEIAACWGIAHHGEVTLEANPTSVEASKFEGFRSAGINRVSIGVQALRDDILRFLGRQHTAEEALRAIATARQVFDRYSFDLMYARPEQTLQEWRTELQDALQYAAGHMSLYQLTIEKGTAFYTQHQRGDFIMPDDDRGADFYELTQEIMDGAGLPLYEVSNHAGAGQESLHNQTYWRYGEYVGIGPGAHGRVHVNGQYRATRAHKAPEVWMDRVRAHGHGAHPFEALDTEKRFAEALMMGLRLREGVSRTHLNAVSGCIFEDQIAEDKLVRLEKEGYLNCPDDDRIVPTIAGLQRLNAMLGYLLS